MQPEYRHATTRRRSQIRCGKGTAQGAPLCLLRFQVSTPGTLSTVRISFVPGRDYAYGWITTAQPDSLSATMPSHHTTLTPKNLGHLSSPFGPDLGGEALQPLLCKGTLVMRFVLVLGT